MVAARRKVKVYRTTLKTIRIIATFFLTKNESLARGDYEEGHSSGGRRTHAYIYGIGRLWSALARDNRSQYLCDGFDMLVVGSDCSHSSGRGHFHRAFRTMALSHFGVRMPGILVISPHKTLAALALICGLIW